MSSININEAIFLQSFSTAFLAPFQRLWLWVIYILTSIRFFIVILHKKAHRSCKSVDRYFRYFMWISVVWCVLQAWAKINIQYGDWTLWREKDNYIDLIIFISQLKSRTFIKIQRPAGQPASRPASRSASDSFCELNSKSRDLAKMIIA